MTTRQQSEAPDPVGGPWRRHETGDGEFVPGADQVRYPNPAEIHEIFLWEESRCVRKTGTISLAGNEYRVD
ncbi:MAG: hypothetical protein FJZ01_28005, partial [Candidatus Sericytochromatia bacterium]|nr:hypothetical protein [Candidatus Tanganyikabacteria bacterium]